MTEGDEHATRGFQTDGTGALWCAVANTEWGSIPGKANDDSCWYPYGGEEHLTSDFQMVTSDNPLIKVRNNGSQPDGALRCGFQIDGTGDLYAAIAITEWGEIPGKAKDDTCWYSYGGEEHFTSDFFWIVCC